MSGSSSRHGPAARSDVRERDGLHAQPATWPERPVARREERLEVLRADGLEHLDRDDRVVLALDLAVVAEQDRHLVLQADGPDALRREVVLRLRDGDRGHAAAELAGSVEREAAPAGADLEHMLARREPGALRHDPVLVALGIGERLVGRFEDGARIRQRLVEEQPVEVVAEVVVRGDVATGAVDRVPPQAVSDGLHELRRDPPPAARQAEAVAVDRCELRERRQIGARPQAGHVRLARPEITAQQDPPDGRDIVDAKFRAQRRFRVAECVALPIGQLDHDAAVTDPPRGRKHDPDGDAVDRPGAPSAARLDGGTAAHGALPMWPRAARCAAAAASACATPPCRKKRRAAEPEAKRVPVDQRDRALGEERVPEQCAEQRAVGQGPAPEDEARR